MKDVLKAYNDLMKENDDIYRCLFKAFGMGECAFWILYLLWEHDGSMTQSKLCHTLCLPKQTVNSALKRMAEDGWLTLCEGEDHRRKRVVLSEQGSQIAKNSVGEVMKREEAAFDCLSTEEKEQFIALFHNYTRHLKESIKPLLLMMK